MLLARGSSSARDGASSRVEDRQSCLSGQARLPVLHPSTYFRNVFSLPCASSHDDPATLSGFSIFLYASAAASVMP